MRKNTYIENADGVCVITEKNEYILIDKEDLEVIKPYYWFVQNKQAYTRIGKKTIGLGKADTREVDHIHHNMLDNRKSQLRIVNRSQNCINTRLNINNSSGVKGVYQQKEGFWIAQISCSGKRYYLGCYKNKSDAIRARKNAEQIYHKGYISQE